MLLLNDEHVDAANGVTHGGGGGAPVVEPGCAANRRT